MMDTLFSHQIILEAVKSSLLVSPPWVPQQFGDKTSLQEKSRRFSSINARNFTKAVLVGGNRPTMRKKKSSTAHRPNYIRRLTFILVSKQC